MTLSKNFWKIRVDKFILLLMFFAFLLSSLFFYLVEIEKNIKNYTEYHQKLEKMVSLNHQLNSFLLKAYHHIDYDEIMHVEEEFEKNLNFLQESDIEKEFSLHIYKDLKSIESTYMQKLDVLEHFKTLNARVTHSIHYLYDLRKTIHSQATEHRDQEEYLDQVFFSIGQNLMDIPLNKVQLAINLEKLSYYGKENKEINYFYQHSKQFLSDMAAIKKNFSQNEKIELYTTIKHVLSHLETSYNLNRNHHKVVAFSLFFLAFLILVILIFNYRQVLRNTRELLAFRYAIENSDNSIVITDRDRRIEYVNDAFEEHTGYMKHEVIGENPNILKSNLMNDTCYKELNETLNSGNKWQGELINKRKDGTLLYEKVSIVPIVLEGKLVQYLAVKLDITDYIEQNKRLEQSDVVYKMIGDGIIITDKDKKILSANPAFVDMFSYEESELLGKEPMVIHALKEDSAFYERMWNKLLEKNRWSGKVHNKTKNGKTLPIWLTITIVRNKNNEIQNFIAIYTNLEEIIEMEEKVNFLAYHDNLTKLPNRAHFEREIVNVFTVAKEDKNKVAILFIDLDRFKVINDTLGHHIGDVMLIELSERIKNILGKNDLLFRIGGDEFVVMLNVLKEKKDAGIMAEKILSVIRQTIHLQDYYLNTTASIGIAIYPDDGMKRSEILKHADSAMYHAKDKGKDNYKYYTKQLSDDVSKRLSLEQELSSALANEEFSLNYQPQYNLNTGKIVAAEVLIRWNNPKLGQVSPDDFIPIAEETGSIIEIGYFVLEEACKEYMRWKKLGFDIDRVAINISSVQFQQENMLKNFIEIMDKVGISPHNIELEITERLVMEYSTMNLTILEDFRKMGCKVSIDDFGTGYSSMSYMKSLSIDTIKIDKSFILELPHNQHDAVVAKAIIVLSQSLGYEVIAEGIETLEQEALLRSYNCDMGQGYYFAKPMSSEDIISFYQQNKDK